MHSPFGPRSPVEFEAFFKKSLGWPSIHTACGEKLQLQIFNFRHPQTSDVAYVLSHSHKSLKVDSLANFNHLHPIPSLLQQSLHIDADGCCRFIDSALVHESWNGDKSWEHCGTCNFCRPLGEGEPQQTVTSVSIKA